MRASGSIVLASTLLVGGCLAEPDDSPDPGDSVAVSRNAPTGSVSGGGRVQYPDFPGLPSNYAETYGFSARSRPDGSVDGQIEFHWPAPSDFKAHGNITCLNVLGNGAWIGLVVTHTDAPANMPVGAELVFYVQDNGSGAAAAPDQVSFFFGAASEMCGFQAGAPARLFDWTHGNITVR